METVLIKIGGSVITKTGDKPININAIKRIGNELRNLKTRVIIIHGTGFIGKPPAIEHGYVNTGYLPKEKTEIALGIRNDIISMNHIFTSTLNRLGVPALSIDNSVFMGYFEEKWKKKSLKEMTIALTSQGIIPVFYGNFLPPVIGKFRVLSSDELVFAISSLVKPSKVLFLTDVNGILDRNNNLISVFDSMMLLEIQDSPYDVSGGMKTKVKTALNLKGHCSHCFIANGNKKNILKYFLSGESVSGTCIF